MGRIIEGFGGRYITADDVGTTLADLIIMREVTCHTEGATAAAQQALPATAFGLFEALRAAAQVCLGRSDLEGLRVAVQGLGNVGMPFRDVRADPLAIDRVELSGDLSGAKNFT